MSNGSVTFTISADAGQVQQAADQAREHLEKAAAAAALLGDIIGVDVPDGVQKLLASTELVGPALESAFAPLAVIALIQAVIEINEKIAQYYQGLRQANAEALDNARSLDTFARSTHLASLELEDLLARHEGRPVQNRLAEALEQARRKADELTDSLESAFRKEEDLLDKQNVGMFAALFTGQAETSRLRDAAKPVLEQIQDLLKAKKAANAEGRKSDAEMYDAQLQNARSALTRIINERQELMNNTKALELAIKTGIDDDSAMAAVLGKNNVNLNKETAESLKEINSDYRQYSNILNDLRIMVAGWGKAEKEVATFSKTAVREAVAANKEEARQFVELAVHGKSKIKEMQSAISQAPEIPVVQLLAAVSTHVADETERRAKASEQAARYDARVEDLTRGIHDAQAEHNTKIAVALGYMTEEQAAQKKLQGLERDKSSALDSINQKLSVQLATLKRISDATMGGLIGTPQQKAALQRAIADYRSLKIQQLETEKRYNAQINAEQLKLTNTFSAQLRRLALEWRGIHQELGQSFLSTLNSMNSNLAEFITTGQANWRQLAASAIQEIIKIGLQWIESHILMAILGDQQRDQRVAGNAVEAQSAAGLAGANAVASAAAIDPFIAPEVGAMDFAAADFFAGIAGFARGGLVPATGLALVHQGETILPASMSGKGDFGPLGSNVHVHVSVQTMDSDSFKDTVHRHGHIIGEQVYRVLRKRGLAG